MSTIDLAQGRESPSAKNQRSTHAANRTLESLYFVLLLMLVSILSSGLCPKRKE